VRSQQKRISSVNGVDHATNRNTHAKQEKILASHVDTHRDEDTSTPSQQVEENGMLGHPPHGESPRDENDTQPNYSLNGRYQEKQTLVSSRFDSSGRIHVWS